MASVPDSPPSPTRLFIRHHRLFQWRTTIKIDGLRPRLAYQDRWPSSPTRLQKCSELSVEVANIQYYEGVSLTSNKSPGRLTFSDVTLERGATQDRDLYDWFNDVAAVANGKGLLDYDYKRNGNIIQQDRDGSTLRKWAIYGAWPVKFVGGEWDNEADENVIESVKLTFDYFERIP